MPNLAKLPSPQDEGGAGKAIIVGYGRVGQLVGDMLKAHAIDFIAVETSAQPRQAIASAGAWKSIGAMPAQPEFLARCGIAKRARPDRHGRRRGASEDIVAAARQLNADLTIVARARDASHARMLYELGVTDAVPETVEASLQLSEAALVDMGIPMGLVIASIHAKRDEYRKALQLADGTARREFRARASSMMLLPFVSENSADVFAILC